MADKRVTNAPLNTSDPAWRMMLSGVMQYAPANKVPYMLPNIVGVDNPLRQAGRTAAVDDVVRVVIGKSDVRIMVAGGSRECAIIAITRRGWRIGEHIIPSHPS